MRSKTIIALLPMAALSLSSCVQEIRSDGPSVREVSFAVADAGRLQVEESLGEPLTRGALVNDASSTFAFGVSQFDPADSPVSTFQNLQPTHERTISTDNELFNSHQHWDTPAYTGSEYAFYAYAPYLSAAANGMTLLSGNKTISYSLSGLSIADMPDLMTAYAESDYIDAVPLTFQHRLAAVGITLGSGWSSGTTVTGIQFSNIITGGTLAISADKDAAWNSYGSRGSYTVPSGFSTTASTAGSVILGASSTYLMMVPQELSGNDVSLTVSLSGSGTTYTLTLPLSGTWEAGKTYTYTLDPLYYTGMTAVYPKWDDGASGTYGPVNAYPTGSSVFGMYAVDPSGSVVMGNIPVNVSAVSGQTATLTLPSGYYYSGSNRYFLYYPYSSSYGAGSVTASASTAAEFFSGIISGWSVSGTQNTEAAFKAQDLQVGMLSGTAFTMQHTMGLAKITLASKAIATTRTYVYGENLTFSDSGTTSQAPPTFSSATTLYHASGSSDYWTILKATGTASNTPVTYNSVTGTRGDHWSLTLSDVGYGKYKAFTVETTLEYLHYVADFPFTGTIQQYTVPWNGSYKLEVWGAQGHTFVTPDNYTWTNNSTSPPTVINFGRQTKLGGYGGYSVGQATLSVSEPLYIVVGEEGPGGPADCSVYIAFPNGGIGFAGDVVSYVGSGGGSTHIATVNSLPKDMASNYTTVLLIMAGGGGSATYTSGAGWDGEGGSGGGYIGNTGTGRISSGTAFCPGTGGSQTGPGLGGWQAYNKPAMNGAFGVGGGSYGEGGTDTAGGGGLWGGGGSWGAGGGGGSGYIGNTRLSNKKMVGYNVATSNVAATKTETTTHVSSDARSDYAKSGHGYARITAL